MLTPSVLPNLPFWILRQKKLFPPRIRAKRCRDLNPLASANFWPGKSAINRIWPCNQPADKNTEMQEGENRVTATDGSAHGDTSINGGEDTPSLEIAEKSDPTISTMPQLMEFANMLPHLAGAGTGFRRGSNRYASPCPSRTPAEYASNRCSKLCTIPG